MFWRSLILWSLAFLPVLAASSASQVIYTGPNRGALAFGPLFTRVEKQSALGIEVGYAEDFRMGLSAFIAASGHAASLTIAGLSVEAGVLRPEKSFPLGIVGSLSMAQTFSGGASSSSGGITAQLYTETGDTTSLIWYPSVIGSLNVGKEFTPSVGVSSDLLYCVSEGAGVDLTAEVTWSRLGTGYGISLSLLFFL